MKEILNLGHVGTLLLKGNDLMDTNTVQSNQTITVLPGATAQGSLSTGALRFERQGNAMTGEPVLSMEDGALVLHYADGASVVINA